MKKGYLIAGVVLAALCIVCVVLLVVPKVSDTDGNVTEEEVKQAVADAYETVEAQVIEVESEEEVADTYVSPVDFSSLQEINSEIHAWLYIPGTDINYPILQSATDDEWYLTHDIEGNYDADGSLFTQATYNSTDFSDPVTIVYGHRRDDGTMFGELQTLYSADGGIETYSELVIYLPETELHYTVFAAVPYDDRHILYTYDFENSSMYSSFLKTINNVRDLSAQFSDTVSVDTNDTLLILSTCLYGDSEKRYLILAREDSDITGTTVETAVRE